MSVIPSASVRDSSISTSGCTASSALGSSEKPRPTIVGRDIGESTLSDRLVLGEGGFVQITVAVYSATGRAMSRPTIVGRGFSDDPKALDAVLPLVEMELSRTEAEGITDTHRIAQAVRRVVGRWVGETYRRRPMIVPVVIPL